uniref:Uncharacterized protein n=1 Tax=Romanomermis culicivorax TaxID=13658 RepID=A0A915I175_ROMCU
MLPHHLLFFVILFSFHQNCSSKKGGSGRNGDKQNDLDTTGGGSERQHPGSSFSSSIDSGLSASNGHKSTIYVHERGPPYHYSSSVVTDLIYAGIA